MGGGGVLVMSGGICGTGAECGSCCSVADVCVVAWMLLLSAVHKGMGHAGHTTVVLVHVAYLL